MTTALTYGPQTDRIEALLAAMRDMTTDQAQRLAAVWDAERGAPWIATWVAARSAERLAGAWVAARVAACDAALHPARAAACDAVTALVVLDLVGQCGLIRKHIDVLAAPILEVMPELARLFEPVDHSETEPRS
jgi:hypothetical protein